MKRTMNDLLDDYRDADFTKRLHLYLQFPELRLQFIEMDRNELFSPELRRLPKAKWSFQFLNRTFGKLCPFPGKA
ncbi:MAG TPA: hypothetical protein VKA69_00520 [Desulfobacteria bacterium]|nr:hypothetical protein [Desulfobacteria bacterium]